MKTIIKKHTTEHIKVYNIGVHNIAKIGKDDVTAIIEIDILCDNETERIEISGFFKKKGYKMSEDFYNKVKSADKGYEDYVLIRSQNANKMLEEICQHKGIVLF